MTAQTKISLVIGTVILVLLLVAYQQRSTGNRLLSSSLGDHETSRATLPDLFPDGLRESPLRANCRKLYNSREGSTTILTKTEPRFLVSLHPQNYDSLRYRIVKDGEYYQKHLTEALFRYLYNRPRSLVVDVGANIGWISLYAAAMGHSVIAFEPNINNVIRFCEAIIVNQFEDRIVLLQAGASNSSANLTLSVPSNPGGGSVVFSRGANAKFTATVPVVPLDSIFFSSSTASEAAHVPILKIDVEGAEPLVLAGAESWLLSNAPDVILVELNPALIEASGNSPRAFLDRLTSTGYAIKAIHGSEGAVVRTRDHAKLVKECTAVILCDLELVRMGLDEEQVDAKEEEEAEMDPDEEDFEE